MLTAKSFLIKNDYSHVIEDYAKQNGIPTKTAKSIFEELMKFLWLASISDLTISPSQTIDGLWHYLLGKEEVYNDLCKTEFGCYLNHVKGEEINIKAYNNGIKLYEQFFNNNHSPFRPILTDKNTKEVALCIPTKQVALCIPTKG